MRKTRAPCKPIAGTPNGIETRIVAVSLLDEDVERPLSAPHDREARGAVSDDRRAGDVLERGLGVADRCTELLRAERCDPLMPPAVRRDLVPASDDLADDRRMVFGDPPQGEKRASRVALSKQL